MTRQEKNKTEQAALTLIGQIKCKPADEKFDELRAILTGRIVNNRNS